MKKGKFKSVLVGSMSLLLALTACTTGQGPAPEITFGGLAAKALKAFDSVNVKATITANDQTNKSYIGDVVAESDSTGCVLSKGMLSLHPDYNKTEITTPVVCNVEFSLVAGGKGFKATKAFHFAEGVNSIAFTGAGDTSVGQNREFDVMKDVKVVANNTRDVSAFVTITAEGAEIVDGKLDTSVQKEVIITYLAEFAGVEQEVVRKVNIVDPFAPVDIFAPLNGDFAKTDISGWKNYAESPAAFTYAHDAAEGTNGALKMVNTVIGPNSYSNRLDFMNIPFEKNTNYEISFKAKSSIDAKKVHIQVGELLPAAPYFTEFQGLQFDAKDFAVVNKDWATYTVEYTHGVDNKRGGLVIEAGNVDGQAAAGIGTLWFDDIQITSIPPLAFTKLTLETPADLTVRVGDEVNLMTGYKALGDDGFDYTEKVQVSASKTITDGKLDTSAEGDIEVAYYANVNGIVAVGTRTVHVVAKDAIINLIKDGSFENAFAENWASGNGGTTKFDKYISDTYGLVIDMDASASTAAHEPQVTQANLALKQGKIYKVSFKASSTLEREIEVRIQRTDNWQSVANTSDQKITLTETPTVFETQFSMMENIEASMQLGFMLGKIGAVAPQGQHTIKIDDVKIYELDLKVNPEDMFGNPLTDATTLNSGKGEAELVADNDINFWYVASADWNCGPIITTSAAVKDGKLDINITNFNLNENNWGVQFFYKSYKMIETADYVLTFDVNAENARTFGINGTDITLVAGVNHITLAAKNVKAGDPFMISAQIGNYKGATDTGLYSFSNFKIAKAVA